MTTKQLNDAWGSTIIGRCLYGSRPGSSGYKVVCKTAVMRKGWDQAADDAFWGTAISKGTLRLAHKRGKVV